MYRLLGGLLEQLSGTGKLWRVGTVPPVPSVQLSVEDGSFPEGPLGEGWLSAILWLLISFGNTPKVLPSIALSVNKYLNTVTP